MKKIKLTKGAQTIIDNEDFEWLNQWRWYLSSNGYAVRREHIRGSGRKNGKSITIRMHRIINKTPVELFTDHINRDKLDNQKHNLRTVTKSKNGFNTNLSKNNSSGYTGIYWDAFTNKWKAEIKVFYKKISLGRHINLEDAVLARKEGKKKYHAI